MRPSAPGFQHRHGSRRPTVRRTRRSRPRGGGPRPSPRGRPSARPWGARHTAHGRVRAVAAAAGVPPSIAMAGRAGPPPGPAGTPTTGTRCRATVSPEPAAAAYGPERRLLAAGRQDPAADEALRRPDLRPAPARTRRPWARPASVAAAPGRVRRPREGDEPDRP